MSSTSSSRHFQAWVGQASNLDRCTRCGRPRSVHGADWNCPGSVTSRTSTLLLMIGLVLAGSSLLLHAPVGGAEFVAQSAAFLIGVGLIVAGITTGG